MLPWGTSTAAAAAVAAIGLTPREIAGGLASFGGLAHRLEPLGRVGRTVFVNDSKATNADSTAYALRSYDRVVLIAGGDGNREFLIGARRESAR